MTVSMPFSQSNLNIALSQQYQFAAAARLLQSASVGPLVMAFICTI